MNYYNIYVSENFTFWDYIKMLFEIPKLIFFGVIITPINYLLNLIDLKLNYKEI